MIDYELVQNEPDKWDWVGIYLWNMMGLILFIRFLDFNHFWLGFGKTIIFTILIMGFIEVTSRIHQERRKGKIIYI